MKPTSLKILRKLKSAGHIAYWAGGCVRDILLGHEPKDYDIVTSALPDEVEKLFKHTKPVGKEFGIILVIENKHAFEVATFRAEKGYSDGRRPDSVCFTDALEDAKRRDFTINGMFYDPVEDKIIDCVEGQKDLEARLVRFIGDPHERILEDHLRILRAVRFKNQLDFQYHPATYKALEKHAKLAGNVSNERIRDELNGMIDGPNPVGCFEDLSELELLEEIIPEMEEMRGVPQPHEFHTEGDVWDHSLRSLRECDAHAARDVKWAALLHDIGKPDTFKLEERIRYNGHTERSRDIVHNIFTRLKFPKKDREEVKWLVEHHMVMVPLIEMNDGAARKWFLNQNFLNLMQVFEADAKGIIPTDMSLYNSILERYRKLIAEMPLKPKPLLNGNEIMKELGIDSGAELGKIVEQLEEMQLSGELKTKAQAKKWLLKRRA